jgi:hypothetical protein
MSETNASQATNPSDDGTGRFTRLLKSTDEALAAAGKGDVQAQPSEEAPPKAKQSITIVAAESNTPEGLALSAVERVLAQIGAETSPIVKRAAIRRLQHEQAIKEVKTELNELAAREALLDQYIEAAKQNISDQRDDLIEDLMVLEEGVNAVTQKRSA